MKWILVTEVCSLCKNSLSPMLDLCTFLCFMLYFNKVNTYVYMPRKEFQFMVSRVDFLVQIPADLLTGSMAVGKLFSFLTVQ